METSFHAVAPGVSLAAHELSLPGSTRHDILVLSALGLCALAYRPFAEAFVREEEASRNANADGDLDPNASSSTSPPPPRSSYRRVVFLDLRHHGESTATEDDEESSPSSLSWTEKALWETLSADLKAAVISLGFLKTPPTVLAHSLGAGVAALAAASSPELFGSLFLFEPPFYPLVAAAEEEGSQKKRDLAKDNASFAASAAAASSLSFGSREDASGLLELAPPFKWWHRSCRGAFVEHGIKWKERKEGKGERDGNELVFRCGGKALAALAAGLMTSSVSGVSAPSKETYRKLGGERGKVVVISFCAQPRSDVTAFLRAGALAAAAEAAAGAAAGAAVGAAASSSSSSSSSSPKSSVVVLPVALPESAKAERSGHYAPLVCPEELARVAAAAMRERTTTTTATAKRERSRF
mgnify:CR=1 FL=1|jgi:pimeloyl-ACP methyl ester carboxylesterase